MENNNNFFKSLFYKIKNKYDKFVFLRKNNKISKDIVLKNIHLINVNDNCNIGENSYLLCWNKYQHGSVNQSLDSKLTIGKNFRATRNLTIQCCNNIKIGNDVLIASNVFICDYNHGIRNIELPYLENELELSEVAIEDGAWIGQGVYILPGVKIGKNAIIGAGSVVTKSVPEYCIAVGNPAKVVKKYNFERKEWEKI